MKNTSNFSLSNRYEERHPWARCYPHLTINHEYSGLLQPLVIKKMLLRFTDEKCLSAAVLAGVLQQVINNRVGKKLIPSYSVNAHVTDTLIKKFLNLTDNEKVPLQWVYDINLAIIELYCQTKF